MLKIFEEYFYLDINEMDKFTQMDIGEPIVMSGELINQISVVKYDTLKLLVEVIMDERDEMDETLGFKNATSKLSVPFKLAFNTLLQYKMIKKY